MNIGRKLLVLLLVLLLRFTISGYSQNKDVYHNIRQRGLSESSFKTGYYYFNNMDYEAAINFFRQSLKIFPRNTVSSYWLGRALLLSGYKEQAIDQWEDLLKHNGSDIFLEQELDRLYSENLRVSKEIESASNYVFLRYLNTEANPVSLRFDQENKLYVADYYGNKIDIYNTNLRKIGSIVNGIQQPTNVFVSKNFIFVSLSKTDTVNIYDIKTHDKIFTIGGFGFTKSKLAGPMGVFEYNGKLAVVDQSNNRIQIFQITPKPYFIAEFGKKGQGAGEFSSPTDIVFFKNQFWVSDKGNQRIQIFDQNGNYIRQLKDKEIESPNKLFFYKDSLFLVDEINGLYAYNKEEDKFSLIKKPSDGVERLNAAAIDNNGILFFSEFTNPRLSSFALDIYKLNALNLRTFFVSNESSPKIVMKLRVQDAVGQDIKGLVSKNFSIEQDGVKMNNVSVSSIRPEKNKIGLTILIRNQKDMKQYQEDIYNYVDKILEKSHSLDRIRVVAYGSKSQLIYDFSGSRVGILNAIRKMTWNDSGNEDNFDISLYNAINQNRFNDMHNAIIILDKIDRNMEFKKYSLGTINSYAKNMGVSLHVINFGPMDLDSQNYEYLTQLTSNSGGSFSHYYYSNTIFNIINTIRSNSTLFYTLSFTAPLFDSKEMDIWSQVVVRLNYRSLSGVDKVGYFLK